MGWRILVHFIRQPMLKLKTHSGFHDLFLNLLKHFQLIPLGALNNLFYSGFNIITACTECF